MGPGFHILLSTLTSTVGVVCLGAGIIGYLHQKTRLYERLLLLAAAFLLIKPGWVTDILGLVSVGGTLLLNLRKTAPPIADTAR